MNIKALWGFEGNAEKLRSDSARVRAGQQFEGVDEEYAHQLIGKGLAAEVTGKASPKSNKQAAPKENK